MSIKLDWEIEAEREQIPSAGEDPAAKRARRRRQLRLLIVILAAALLALGALMFTSCDTPTGQGAMIGGGTGALRP